MAYVYRYIDMNKRECVYVGKVMGDKDVYIDPLGRRHDQHRREEWYKKIGDANLLLQYVQVPTHADADILETYYISVYEGTGQLVNKAKTGWGKSTLDFISPNEIVWKNYMRECSSIANWLKDKFSSIASEIAIGLIGKARREDVVNGAVSQIREAISMQEKANRAAMFESGLYEPFIRKDQGKSGGKA